MEKILTNQFASLTEFREPNKVIEKAGDKPVAIMNRNSVLGYYVPKSALDISGNVTASVADVKAILQKRKRVMQPVNDFLKDK